MSRAKDKEQNILEAASAVFGSKGFHHASISEIAEAAGIGKGTVYEYFSSKDALLLAVIQSNCSRYIEGLRDEIARESSFGGKLDCFIDFHLHAFREYIQLVEMMQYECPGLKVEIKSTLQKIILSLRRAAIEILEGIFELGSREGLVRQLDYEFSGDLFLDMIVRLCIRSTISNTEEDARKEREKLNQMLLHGIGC